MKSQVQMKGMRHSVSGRSYMASTPDSSNVAVYEVRNADRPAASTDKNHHNNVDLSNYSNNDTPPEITER